MLAETIAIQVVPYADAALADALSDQWRPVQRVVADAHYAFLSEYLGGGAEALHAQTILTEAPYLSQSYLADYAHYYALSFTPYERFCKRVHFFGVAFTRAELDEALLAPPDQAHPLWDSYIGYVVVKPLPMLVGATLLRPYRALPGRRPAPPVLPHHARLPGEPARPPLNGQHAAVSGTGHQCERLRHNGYLDGIQ